MKIAKKVLAVILAISAVAFCFAGCSGNGDDAKTSDAKVKVVDIELTNEDYAFGVDKEQPELLQQVNDFVAELQSSGKFDEILNNHFGDGTPVAIKSAAEDSSKDQLVVATNAAFEPFEYTRGGDEFFGIDMEIADLLAKELNKELVIKNMDFESVCLSVGQHKADIAMAGLTVTPDREENVTFSTPYYKAAQKLIVPTDNTEFDACKTADDVVAVLNAKDESTKIGSQTGTTGQFYVEGDEDFGFDGLPCEFVGYKNGSLAVQDLINGNISYVIIDAAPAKCITEAINAVA